MAEHFLFYVSDSRSIFEKSCFFINHASPNSVDGWLCVVLYTIFIWPQGTIICDAFIFHILTINHFEIELLPLAVCAVRSILCFFSGLVFGMSEREKLYSNWIESTFLWSRARHHLQHRLNSFSALPMHPEKDIKYFYKFE